MKNYCALRIMLVAGMLAYAGTTAAVENDACKRSCSADLDACRAQADRAADMEASPLISGRSKSAVYDNGQLSPLIRSGGPSEATDVQRRKLERYQQCATENRGCEDACLPAQAPSGRSVILK